MELSHRVFGFPKGNIVSWPMGLVFSGLDYQRHLPIINGDYDSGLELVGWWYKLITIQTIPDSTAPAYIRVVVVE